MKTLHLVIALMTVFSTAVFAATYTSGHADLGLGEGTELELHLHIHEDSIVDGSALTDDTEFSPDAVTIWVPNSTRFSRQIGAEWNLIGNNAGDDTWRLPESHTHGVPFLGIGAEEVTLGTFVDNELTLTLTGVSGPGHFSLYTTDFGAPIFSMSSFDGISSDDSILLDLDIEDHAHFNFGFSQAGTYQISFEVSAYTDTQTPVLVSDEATFTFNVVPEPATFSLLALGGVALLRKRK